MVDQLINPYTSLKGVPITDLRELEKRIHGTIRPNDLARDLQETSDDIAGIDVHNVEPAASIDNDKINDVFDSLPTNKNGVLYPEFWGYLCKPWGPVFVHLEDIFDDKVKIWWGPRGGGKTISGVATNIIDGQMKGVPCISNVPFAWIAKDYNGYLYRIESIPFDQEKFARGDPNLKYKRLMVDEGNYLADSLRATSNKNLAMVDIIQQARKFRMSIDFCTINWMWLDHRLTGSLCDTVIECTDLFYKPAGKREHVKKGHWIAWNLMDQSGKTTGKQFNPIGGATFNARFMWRTYDTLNYVDPREARKRLKAEVKTLVNEFGVEVTQEDWLKELRSKLHTLAQSETVWDSNELWDSLGILNQGLRIKAGQYMRGKLGIDKNKSRTGSSSYDLSGLLS